MKLTPFVTFATFAPVALATLLLTQVSLPAHAQPPTTPAQQWHFNRIATFEAARNVPAGRKVSKKSVAEIVAASEDGRLLAYTDSEQQGIGLIDIRNPAQPQPAGFVPVNGEPTSVVITRGRALVAVNASLNFAQPDGHIAVVDLTSQRVTQTCRLYGQPDSVALDKSARHLLVAIENERDEKFNKGLLPQLPGGNLTIVPLRQGLPDCPAAHPVAMNGLADIAPNDSEPEFVKVNRQGLAVVTLQENNHIALVDVARRAVTHHFSAGSVNLTGIDTKSDGTIAPTDSLSNVKREPDAVAWLDDTRFVTANEGDYQGGSRGFSIFNTRGEVEYDSGNLLDHKAMRMGHYPDKRSKAKGSEPEGVETGQFGADKLIFVGAERASLIYVFRDMGPGNAPQYLQALPSGQAPEGLLAIPQRNLFVVAAENDGAARSSVTLYQRGQTPAHYPGLVSNDDAQGLPVGWGAISGSTAVQGTTGQLWAVTDSAYATTRLLRIDARQQPARITQAITLNKDGKAMGYDAEGVAERAEGGFWIASEGDPQKKGGALDNLLLRVAADGTVQEEISLPQAWRQHAERFGLEGVTVTGRGEQETVWLAMQREWKDDPKGRVKILSYRPSTQTWGAYHYPLDTPKAEGAWVGLSEITALDNDTFAVIERDNQFGPASLKTVKTFSVAGLQAAAPGDAQLPLLTKRPWLDLVPHLARSHGTVQDKVESFAIDSSGQGYAISDNDGVDGSSGETQFLRLGKLR